MFSIWIHYKGTKTTLFKYKDCSVKTLGKIIDTLKTEIKTSFIEITAQNAKPVGMTLPQCETRLCGECPRSLKKTCPMYKIFKNNAKVYPKTPDQLLNKAV